MTVPEPKRLSLGKAYHKKVQDEWDRELGSDVEREHAVTKPSRKGGIEKRKKKRTGRIDIFWEDGGETVGVVEMKHSD